MIFLIFFSFVFAMILDKNTELKEIGQEIDYIIMSKMKMNSNPIVKNAKFNFLIKTFKND